METVKTGTSSTVLLFPPETIVLNPRQVARYAGGSDFRTDGRMEKMVLSVLGRAADLLAPAAVYALHPVSEVSEEGTLHLENGLSVEMPENESDSSIKVFAAIVCTIGPALEAACRELIAQGDSLTALFLDAAGVAALEELGERTFAVVSERAEALGLTAGCRFVPGCMEIPMYTQEFIFSLADGEKIGVRLNSSMVMQPGKSVSFFVPLAEGPPKERKSYKCRECGLEGCKFRVGPR